MDVRIHVKIALATPACLSKQSTKHYDKKIQGIIGPTSIRYIENNTWQNLYHTPYQPETPISARGP